MESVVLDTRNHGEDQEGEDLGHVGGAGDEGELLDERGSPEDRSHLFVIELTEEQPGSRVESDADLPDVFLRSEVPD